MVVEALATSQPAVDPHDHVVGLVPAGLEVVTLGIDAPLQIRHGRLLGGVLPGRPDVVRPVHGGAFIEGLHVPEVHGHRVGACHALPIHQNRCHQVGTTGADHVEQKAVTSALKVRLAERAERDLKRRVVGSLGIELQPGQLRVAHRDVQQVTAGAGWVCRAEQVGSATAVLPGQLQHRGGGVRAELVDLDSQPAEVLKVPARVFDVGRCVRSCDGPRLAAGVHVVLVVVYPEAEWLRRRRCVDGHAGAGYGLYQAIAVPVHTDADAGVPVSGPEEQCTDDAQRKANLSDMHGGSPLL
jgi:hypothetical protein